MVKACTAAREDQRNSSPLQFGYIDGAPSVAVSCSLSRTKKLLEDLGISRKVKYQALRHLERVGAIALIRNGKHALQVRILGMMVPTHGPLRDMGYGPLWAFRHGPPVGHQVSLTTLSTSLK